MTGSRTSSNTVDLVLNEKVNERHKGSEKGTGKELAVLDSRRVVGAERNAASGPGESSDNVGNHENIMPIVVVGRGNVGPATTREGTQDTHEGDKAWQLGAGLAGKEVPETDKGETGAYVTPISQRDPLSAGESSSEIRTRSNGNEDHEKGPLGIAIANGGGDGGEPLVRVAIEFILDNLVVVEGDANDEGAEEGS